MRRLQRVLFGLCAIIPACGSLRAVDIVIGVVAPHVPVALEMPFTNTGKLPVQVGDIVTSCDCLQTTQSPGDIVAPGATITVPFTYRGSATGTVSVTVTILGVGKDEVLDRSTVSGFVTDPSWQISAMEMLAQNPAPVVVDTRRNERYQQAHITRSINLPLFAVKTRTDLRKRAVVLVDEGIAPHVLLAEIEALRASGFENVRMLIGGVAGWRRQGGQLTGVRTESAVELARISPAETAAARRVALLDVVEVSQVEEVLGLAPNTSAKPLVVIANDEAVYAGIEARLDPKMTRPVYYLRDGRSAWAAYQITQSALAANSGQVFQTKSTTGRPSASGGCGSCSK